MFYIEGNAKLQAHILDTVNQAIHVAEGELTNGAFSLTLSNGENISGTASEAGIAVALNRVPFQASRVSIFGADMKLGGRYFGVAHNPNGTSRVTLQMDANRNVVLVQETGTTLTGGSGKAEPSQAASNRFTFTLDRVIGGNSPVTGSFTLSDGVLEGSFTNPAGTFTFTSHKKALANRLANISTRGLVGPGQGQLIGGFIITGGPKLVLIRAVGPSLAAAGVSPALADPALELFSGSTMIGSNDNWKNNENAAQIVSTGVAPTNDVEAALLVRLEEGAYTPVVTGTGDGNGIALVEIYELGSE
ncbi:MAG TPA: hypothetical protein VK993_04265 [Chthoniobacterales bacterium]|nr:hypothetical protein [Chthoniobacterales bacterium]